MQKSKSLIVKILTVLFALCCVAVMMVGQIACADPVTIDSAKIENGKLVLVLTDGTTIDVTGESLKGDKGDDGEKGDKGDTGATGSTGAAGAAGVGVEEVEMVDGKLVITLTNGTKKELTMPEAQLPTCEHDFRNEKLVVETCTEKGIMLSACKNCGFAKIEDIKELDHNFGTEEMPNILCSQDHMHYESLICSNEGCGEIKKVEREDNVAIGHMYAVVEDTYVAKTCDEDGSFQLQCMRRPCFPCMFGDECHQANETAHKPSAYTVKPTDNIADFNEATQAAINADAELKALIDENGYFTGLAATGHDYPEDGYIIKIEEVNPCEDGALVGKICKNCTELAITYQEFDGHDVAVWAKVEGKDPTATADGELTGYCARCEQDVIEVLKPFGTEGAGWTKTVVTAKEKCSDVGENKWSITVGTQTFDYTEILVATAHTLNGELVDANAIVDLNVPANAAAVKRLDNGAIDCGAVGVYGAGYYVCSVEGCGVEVSVRTIVPHTAKGGKITEAGAHQSVEPTCVTDGNYWYQCKECNEFYSVKQNATGVHNVKYTLEKVGDKIYLLADCPTCGGEAADCGECDKCTDNDNKTACKYAEWNYKKEITDYSETKTDATCTEDGEIVISAKDPAGNQLKDIKIKINAYGHGIKVVGGDRVSIPANTKVYLGTNYAYYYDSEDVRVDIYKETDTVPANIIKTLDNGSTNKPCETVNNEKVFTAGYYTCNCCEEAEQVSIQVTIDHTADSDTPKATVAATCTTPKIETYHCSVCDKDYDVKVGKALEHVLMYKIDEGDAKDDGLWDVIEYCGRTGLETACPNATGRVIANEVELVELTDRHFVGTCLEVEKKYYSYDVDGQEGITAGDPVFEVKLDVTDHTVGSKDGKAVYVNSSDIFVIDEEHGIVYSEDGKTVLYKFSDGLNKIKVLQSADESCDSVAVGAGYVVCACCNEEISIKLRTAHTWVADTEKTNVAAKCEVEGHNYWKCSVCGEEYDEVLTLSHKYVATYEEVSEGVYDITYTCTNAEELCNDNRVKTINNVAISSLEILEDECEAGNCSQNAYNIYLYENDTYGDVKIKVVLGTSEHEFVEVEEDVPVEFEFEYTDGENTITGKANYCQACGKLIAIMDSIKINGEPIA